MISSHLAWLIRRHGVEMTHLSGGSHIASILSVADIVAVLYSDVLHFDCKNPKLAERDRFILSKGHAGAAIYAALAESGFFSTEELKTHYQNGSRLSGHVSHKGVPGVEFSTGSLGHGLPVAAGMAHAAKLDAKQHRVYVVMGDGECDEGSVWEAAMYANHYGLNNLVAIIDHNKMQSLDYCENTMKLSPFAEKWRSFGWNCLEIDGHDHDELRAAFEDAKNSDKPTAIIANTVKGKGISFMEFDILWHYRFPHDGWEYDGALKELHAQMPKGLSDPYEKEAENA
ncbi:MAG: transketolase [Ruminococcaceae bacterium]|nr:transketolase [Oscillospiraceae bacterium]